MNRQDMTDPTDPTTDPTMLPPVDDPNWPPPPPTPVLSVKINGAGVSAPQPGAWFELSGSVTVKYASDLSVVVRFDGRTYDVTLSGSGYTKSWRANVQAYRPGNFTATVSADAQGEEGAYVEAQASASVQITLGSTEPDLTVVAPAAGALGVPIGGLPVDITATTSTGFGARTMSWELVGAGSGGLVEGPTGTFKGTFQLPAAPLGARVLRLRCRDAVGNTATRDVTLAVQDITPPTLTVQSPTPNKEFTLKDGAATIPVTGAAVDGQSGVRIVQYRVDGGAWTDAVAASPGWAAWSASPNIYGYGTHTIGVQAVDAAGKVTATDIPVRAVSEYRPASLEERLSQRAYLDSLLGFAQGQATVPGGALLSKRIAEVFRQQFAELSTALAAHGDAGHRPVNELTGVIDVLRRHVEDKSPKLAGHWTFDDDAVSGNGAGDRSGNGHTLTFPAGLVRAPGRSGQAVSFDGSTNGGLLPHTDRFEIGWNGTDFTVSFYINVRQGPTGLWRKVMHKGNDDLQRTFAIWLQPDALKLHARFSTTTEYNSGLNGTASLQLNTWTHVTFVKRGNQALLYLDGKLDSSASFAGRVVGNDGPLRVGGASWGPGFNGMLDDLRVFTYAVDEAGAAKLATGANLPTPETVPAAAEAEYRWTAYQILLGELGTSYEELRLVRGADQVSRQALAERLGLPLSPSRPDQLDSLTLEPAVLTEDALERLFGLRDTGTAKPQLRQLPRGQVLEWREEWMRVRWARQDRTATGREFAVIVDPDLLSDLDVRPASQAAALLAARRTTLGAVVQGLRTRREAAADPGAGYRAVLADALPATDLDALDAQERAGADIEPQLAAAGLTREAFLLLRRIKALTAAVGAQVTAAEWDSLYAVLTQVKKVAQYYPQWRAEESALTLSPDQFVPGAAAPRLPAWRARQAARRGWETVLRSRAQEHRALTDGHAALLAATEESALPVLRDALLDAARIGARPDAADALGERYQLPVGAGGALRTTRILQAVETLQNVMFSLRVARFGSGHPAGGWKLTSESDFDADWAWMGGYDTWRAALLAFLYPENQLDPTRRTAVYTPDPTRSAPFTNLVGRLRSVARLSPVEARQQAAAYWQELPQALRDRFGTGFQLTDVQTDTQLLALRELSQRLLSPFEIRDTIGVPKAPYLQPAAVDVLEVLYFVPLLLAQGLQASGEYVTALDWLQRVYAYHRPTAERKVCHLLALEQHGPADLTLPPRWTKNLNPHTVAAGRPNPYTRYTLLALIRCFVDFADSEFAREETGRARGLYGAALDLLALPDLWPTGVTTGDVAFPNQDAVALGARARAQLAKIGQGRNIAGMLRTVDLGQAMTAGAGAAARRAVAPPTPYRFRSLVERSRQLAGQASAVEAQYLAALEKYDEKTYRRFEADQAVQLSAAQVTLAARRLTEAETGTELATAQQERAAYLAGHYADRLQAGLNSYEQRMLKGYKQVRDMRNVIGALDATIGVAQLAAQSASLVDFIGSFGIKQVANGVASAAMIGKAVAGGKLNLLEEQLQANTFMAGMERQKDDWRLQLGLAEKDGNIAAKQGRAAAAHLDVVAQEKAVAELQASQAQATLLFLDGQFTSAELYHWMAQVLGGVYRYFLQQATAVARLAQEQLAFERQESVSTFVRTDYWQAPGDGADADRRGLTGSARLLQDVQGLDQYAFDTDRRKLNITQTFSVAQLAPVEFARFRQTGELDFATPMRWFDEAFPGHYLRLVRRVKTSLVALVPPGQGIRATLASSGISRVVARSGDAGATLTETALRRDPELVALTSPVSATGVFELDAQSEMLLPFEGTGVDTTWRFELPRAANAFDYSSIADVVLTVEYTAMHSEEHRARVVERLNSDQQRSGERMFSLREDFPDLWYALHNPETAGPRGAGLTLARPDFPAQLDQLAVGSVALCVLDLDSSEEIPKMGVTLTRGALGGDAQTYQGVASTRRGNAAAWTALCGQPPAGDWQLAFGPEADELFDSGRLDDILLVVGWIGQAPRWSA
ncbi:LamG-like jellyroll fold domain-containing protein [Kitasatospora griseola]|uniref:Tc toxin subunit A-related protein n=1 Tax=Kitasatospora griseola TaxID=2064 RepID=UPI0036D86692